MEQRRAFHDVFGGGYPEFVLIGARDNPEKAYDISLDTEREDYSYAETIRNLRMWKSRHPVKPLFQGDWA